MRDRSRRPTLLITLGAAAGLLASCGESAPRVDLQGCRDLAVGETIGLSVEISHGAVASWMAMGYPGERGNGALTPSADLTTATFEGLAPGRVIIRVYADIGPTQGADSCIIRVGGEAADAGVSPQDAGETPRDAGETPHDAGGPPRDGGPPTDSGGPMDSGAPPPCAPTPLASWQDSAFTRGWSLEKVEAMSYGTNSWTADTVAGGCSDPATALQVTLLTSSTNDEGAAIWILGLRDGATHDPDPASGAAICGVRMSIEGSDERLPVRSRKTAVSIALRQGETIYWTRVFSVEDDACMSKTDWTEADFVRFSGPGPATPDFRGGPPMQFGLLVGQSRRFDGEGTPNPHIVDGWRIELYGDP